MKKQIIFLIISIIGILLFVFNYWTMKYLYDFRIGLIASGILIFIGLSIFVLYKLLHKSNTVLIKIMFGVFTISFLINIYLSFENYKRHQRLETLNEYFELKICEELENRFYDDLENDKIKYFTHGHVPNIKRTELLKSKYQIESIFLGDLILHDMKCYNKLVEKYLEENYNVKIKDLYPWPDKK